MQEHTLQFSSCISNLLELWELESVTFSATELISVSKSDKEHVRAFVEGHKAVENTETAK